MMPQSVFTNTYLGSSSGLLEESTSNDIGENFDIIPILDQSFPSFQEVEIFLDYFSRFHSFSVVLLRSQKIFDIVMQATFGCYRSGKYRCRSTSSSLHESNISQNSSASHLNMHSQKSVKTDCPWRVNVRYSTRTSRFVITKVVLDHNHLLSSSPSGRICLNNRNELNFHQFKTTDRLKELGNSNTTNSNMERSFCNPNSHILDISSYSPDISSFSSSTLFTKNISLSLPSTSIIKKSRRSRNRPFQATYTPLIIPSSMRILSVDKIDQNTNHQENSTLNSPINRPLGIHNSYDDPSSQTLQNENQQPHHDHDHDHTTYSLSDEFSNQSFNFSFDDHSNLSDLDHLSQAISLDISSVLRYSMPSFKETE